MNIRQRWSDFLDRFMQVKKIPKTIANVFGPDKMRIGVIKAREKRVGLRVVIIYCFEGRNGNRPAFYGWCDTESKIKEFIITRYPDSFITPSTEFDYAFDLLEKMGHR